MHLYGPRRARRWWWSSQPLDRESAYLHPGYLLRFYVFLVPPGGARGAGAGRLVQLPYWTRSTPSFAPPGGVRGPGAGAGRLVLLTCWTRSTPSFAPPGGVRGAGAGRLVQLPYWTRSTPSFRILRAARGRARSWSWTAGATTLMDEVFYPTSDPAADFGNGPDVAAGGRAAGRGVCFLRLSGPLAADFGPGQEIRRRDAQLDGEFVFPRLRLSPPTSGLARRGRRRGVWRGVCLSIFHSLASRREAKVCSVTGPNTI